ncbi:MAG: chloride channel protein, partial [Nitrospira sp.]|nr:chloride channel protein [Nitrospira sp.]
MPKEISRKFDPGDLIAPQPYKPLGRVTMLAALLGVMVGVVGVAFFTVSHLLSTLLLGSAANLKDPASGGHGAEGWFHYISSALPASDPSSPHVWLLVLIPALGGLAVGLWRRKMKDETASGTEFVLDSFHNRKGELPKGTLWKKFVASCLTLGTGGAAGREGPIALMGAAIGGWLASKLHLTRRQLRVLLAAGLAAGVGGMFRAPLAGGLMAAEVLYSDSEFEPDVLVPSMVASVTSYCVFCLNFGWGSLFGKVAADYQFTNPLELFPLTVLALAVAGGGWLFVLANRHLPRLLGRLPMVIRPMIGAGVAGAVALGLYFLSGAVSDDGEPTNLLFSVMGDGYEALQLTLNGGGIWWVLLLLAVGKMIAS